MFKTIIKEIFLMIYRPSVGFSFCKTGKYPRSAMKAERGANRGSGGVVPADEIASVFAVFQEKQIEHRTLGDVLEAHVIIPLLIHAEADFSRNIVVLDEPAVDDEVLGSAPGFFLYDADEVSRFIQPFVFTVREPRFAKLVKR